MKAVGYALTASVVIATYLCRDAHELYLDSCYTQRPAPNEQVRLLDLRVDALLAGTLGEDEDEQQGLDVDAQIHWGSGLSCFMVFYTGQLMLALAYRGKSESAGASCEGGHSDSTLGLSWRIGIEAVGAHVFRVLVYVWVVLPMGLRMEKYA